MIPGVPAAKRCEPEASVANIVYRRVPRADASLIDRFRRLDVATVHEVTGEDLLLDPRIRPLVPGLVVAGPAITARNTPGDNLALHVALELSEPGDLLVMTTGPQPQNAIWGEQVTVFAQGRGVAGVVCDGAVRDTAYLREVGFPVWAALVFARRSTKAQPVEVNVPIVCGGVLVNPGDIVVADDDGAVVVRREAAEDVAGAAEKRKAAELERRSALSAGQSPYSLLGLERELQRMGTHVVDGVYGSKGS